MGGKPLLEGRALLVGQGAIEMPADQLPVGRAG
jgi:hypothetical protein